MPGRSSRPPRLLALFGKGSFGRDSLPRSDAKCSRRIVASFATMHGRLSGPVLRGGEEEFIGAGTRVGNTPEISVVVSTFERPGHLRRCLASLAVQRGVAERFEVVVIDDGSRDETASVVRRLAAEVPFPLSFVTHAHDGFQLARCRNSGIRAAKAPYVLFTDGDCIFPSDHLAIHLAARKPGFVQAGDCFKLDQAASESLDVDAVRSGEWVRRIPRHERAALRRRHLKALVYQAMRHPKRPKIIGNNLGVWKDDLVAVNGFDERFRGWGCEDDDLAARLRRRGVRIQSILGKTQGCHLWHPVHSTAPQKWQDGPNFDYLHRPLRPVRCLAGLRPRSFEQLNVSVAADGPLSAVGRRVASWFTGDGGSLDLEVLLGPGQRSFASEADLRVLVVNQDDRSPVLLASRASAVVRIRGEITTEKVLAELRRLAGTHRPASTLSAAA